MDSTFTFRIHYRPIWYSYHCSFLNIIFQSVKFVSHMVVCTAVNYSFCALIIWTPVATVLLCHHYPCCLIHLNISKTGLFSLKVKKNQVLVRARMTENCKGIYSLFIEFQERIEEDQIKMGPCITAFERTEVCDLLNRYRYRYRL